MPQHRPKATVDDVILYAEEMISESLRSGSIEPALALELVHYATEPELVAAVRIFAGLSEAQRSSVISYARALEPTNGAARGDLEHLH